MLPWRITPPRPLRVQPRKELPGNVILGQGQATVTDEQISSHIRRPARDAIKNPDGSVHATIDD